MASHFTVLQFTCTLLYSVRSLPFEPTRSLELPLMTSASSRQLSSVREIQRIYTKAQLSQQMGHLRPFKSAANGSCSASTVARLPGSKSVSVSDVRRGWCTIMRSMVLHLNAALLATSAACRRALRGGIRRHPGAGVRSAERAPCVSQAGARGQRVAHHRRLQTDLQAVTRA
jgi:hypothetical protein